jgi:hypothetical protein
MPEPVLCLLPEPKGFKIPPWVLPLGFQRIHHAKATQKTTQGATKPPRNQAHNTSHRNPRSTKSNAMSHSPIPMSQSHGSHSSHLSHRSQSQSQGPLIPQEKTPRKFYAFVLKCHVTCLPNRLLRKSCLPRKPTKHHPRCPSTTQGAIPVPEILSCLFLHTGSTLRDHPRCPNTTQGAIHMPEQVL